MREHSKPPWWPEGEAWPPRRWEEQHRRLHERDAEPRWDRGGWWGQRQTGMRRGGMRRGIGCFVAMLSTLVCA